MLALLVPALVPALVSALAPKGYRAAGHGRWGAHWYAGNPYASDRRSVCRAKPEQ